MACYAYRATQPIRQEITSRSSQQYEICISYCRSLLSSAVLYYDPDLLARIRPIPCGMWFMHAIHREIVWRFSVSTTRDYFYIEIPYINYHCNILPLCTSF